MPRIGYARVSTTSQDLEIQQAKLKAAGCEIIRAETSSGASRDGRTELATVLEFLREGDELVVHRLDRLGRSTRDVLNLVHELDAKGASLRVLELEVTTAGDMGRMVITILGMVADMELKFIRDRQRAGIDAAKDKGVYKGRQKRVDDDAIRRLASEGGPKAQIARDLGGGLAEALERFSSMLRRRLALEDRIRALTAQGRLQGVIMGALPILLGGVLMLMEPETMSLLFSEPAGWAVCALVVALEAVGVVLIRRIVNIEV